MFHKILVPIDLAHLEALHPALQVSADLAIHYDAELCYLGVTATTPGAVARTPEEYARKLSALAENQKQTHGQRVSSHCVSSPDPVADLDESILGAIRDLNIDLVIMQTHLPMHLDALVPAHGGRIASQAAVSCFLIRGEGE